jgi:hypothetical protein
MMGLLSQNIITMDNPQETIKFEPKRCVLKKFKSIKIIKKSKPIKKKYDLFKKNHESYMAIKILKKLTKNLHINNSLEEFFDFYNNLINFFIRNKIKILCVKSYSVNPNINNIFKEILDYWKKKLENNIGSELIFIKDPFLKVQFDWILLKLINIFDINILNTTVNNELNGKLNTKLYDILFYDIKYLNNAIKSLKPNHDLNKDKIFQDYLNNNCSVKRKNIFIDNHKHYLFACFDQIKSELESSPKDFDNASKLYPSSNDFDNELLWKFLKIQEIQIKIVLLHYFFNKNKENLLKENIRSREIKKDLKILKFDLNEISKKIKNNFLEQLQFMTNPKLFYLD